MKNRVPIITTCLIGASLLAVAIFVTIEQKTLAAEPQTDPGHAAHVAAAANQSGGQAVEAQLAEMLTRIERLEAITQQQPGQSPAGGAMPMGAENPPRMRRMAGMGSDAMPAPGGMAGMDMTGGRKARMGVGAAVADQLADLRAKMQRLEVAIQQQSGSASAERPMSGMGGMGGSVSPPGGEMGMMGMMDKMMGGMGGGAMPTGAPMGGSAPGGGMLSMDKMEMGGMGGGSSGGGGMGMMDMDKMEMAGMMGMMGGMGGKGGAGMAMPSALPGFPGASHLYHVGATGFFLNHPQHIALSREQQMMLNRVKEKAALDKASCSRNVQEAEQDLWTLTAADQPDNAQIEAKVAEIEKLRGDARLRFIRTIGDAAKILNDEQRKILTGFAPPVSAAPAAAPMAGAMKGM
jgi:Spy/CpxP family protein refolding chaperone